MPRPLSSDTLYRAVWIIPILLLSGVVVASMLVRNMDYQATDHQAAVDTSPAVAGMTPADRPADRDEPPTAGEAHRASGPRPRGPVPASSPAGMPATPSPAGREAVSEFASAEDEADRGPMDDRGPTDPGAAAAGGRMATARARNGGGETAPAALAGGPSRTLTVAGLGPRSTGLPDTPAAPQANPFGQTAASPAPGAGPQEPPPQPRTAQATSPADAGAGVDSTSDTAPDAAAADVGETEAAAADAGETEEAAPWPNANCPPTLPEGSSETIVQQMMQSYGCEYLRYCQALNDGTGGQRCWWGVATMPGTRS